MRRLFLIGGLLLLTLFGLLARDQISRLLVPLAVGTRHFSLSLRSVITTLSHLPQIPGELERRDREIARLGSSEVERSKIVTENEELRRLLSLPGRSQRTQSIGEIVGSLPGSFGSQLLVRLSTEQPMAVGSPVYARGSAFGRVVAEQGSQLVIEPITSPRTAIAVTLGEQSGVGLLRGENGTVVVDDISAAYQVAVGDVVRVAAGDETFPQGTAVGTVKEVISSEGAFLKRAVLELTVQPRTTLFVEFRSVP